MIASDATALAFVLLVAAVVGAIAFAAVVAGRHDNEPLLAVLLRIAVVVGVDGLWLSATNRAAASGTLLDFTASPPRLSRLVAALSISTVIFAFLQPGRWLTERLPLAAVVGFQFFRLPVELLLHQLHEQNVVPVQMTFQGLNFDILTGLSAPVVAYLAHRGAIGRRAVFAWNTMGLVLLATIVVVANLSTPAFRVFAPDARTAFLATRPFVWLPTVLVPAALFAHVVTYRRLAMGAAVR